jgi:hypothetical protein
VLQGKGLRWQSGSVVGWLEWFVGCWRFRGSFGFAQDRLFDFAQDDRFVPGGAGSRFLPFDRLRVGMTERRARAKARARAGEVVVGWFEWFGGCWRFWVPSAALRTVSSAAAFAKCGESLRSGWQSCGGTGWKQVPPLRQAQGRNDRKKGKGKSGSAERQEQVQKQVPAG